MIIHISAWISFVSLVHVWHMDICRYMWYVIHFNILSIYMIFFVYVIFLSQVCTSEMYLSCTSLQSYSFKYTHIYTCLNWFHPFMHICELTGLCTLCRSMHVIWTISDVNMFLQSIPILQACIWWDRLFTQACTCMYNIWDILVY